jgi:hypothetical protein
MVERSTLRIADITMEITCDDPELRLQVEGAKNQFLIDGVQTEVIIRALWGDLSEEPSGEKLFDSGSTWQLYYKEDAYLFRFTSLVFGSLPYKIAFFNPEFSSGEVYLHRPFFNKGQSVDPLAYPLDELLTINLLAKGRGTEVHACGIVDSLGRGHLFVGQSGAGKSTMARLWENEPNIIVLSDDRIILRKMKNSIWMYGTPWHGEAGVASPAQVPLTTIYFLEKGQKNELIAQKPSDSISRLFACSFSPFYNREALNFTLGFLEDVVINVPCYGLKFKPDKSVVELITSNKHFHSL